MVKKKGKTQKQEQFFLLKGYEVGLVLKQKVAEISYVYVKDIQLPFGLL